MMRPKRTFVKCFVVRNSLHYIIGWATRQSACLGQNLDLQARRHDAPEKNLRQMLCSAQSAALHNCLERLIGQADLGQYLDL